MKCKKSFTISIDIVFCIPYNVIYRFSEANMERLERKKINGRFYYYYSKWARVNGVNGRCRRIWQKYLGKLEDIAKAVEGGGPAPLFAEVFQWGLPSALWKECCSAEVVTQIDKLCPKRAQGLTTGEYVEIASINRAIGPNSKRSMWEWFSQTTLMRLIPRASKAALTSQRFWDHMDRIDGDKALTIWKNILSGVIKREEIDLSSVSYDGTNFYTFIDTFNTKCEIAKRGKNKQGRNNLRQINYALFCSAEGHMPLFYDSYEGNRNDAKHFPLMLKKFHDFINEMSGQSCTSITPDQITLVSDKGNNSQIIKAYRSQYIIEDVFKEMKDRNTGSWWPLHHWTDSKIKVHALYCTIALLIRALMYRKVRQNGLKLSMKRVLKELDGIREVINFYPKKRAKKNQTIHSVLTKTSEIQKQLIQILRLKDEKTRF